MDLLNSLNQDESGTTRWISKVVMADALKAVPPDRLDLEWRGVNDAHALKQGLGKPGAMCYMHSYSCTTKDKSASHVGGVMEEDRHPVCI